MTTTLAAQNFRQSFARILALGLVVTIAFEAIYYYGGLAGEPDDTPIRAVAVTALAASVVAAAVWGLTHRLYETGTPAELGSRSVVLGILALVSILGYWLGVFGPICIAAALFGRKAADAGAKREGYIGMALGLLSFSTSIVLLVTAV